MTTLLESKLPVRVLDVDGTPAVNVEIDEPPELLLDMYRWMVFGRTFDNRLMSLQRQGRLSTYAPVAGQEAIQVGCGLALNDDDWALGTYRDGLACIVHGMPAEQLPLYFRGHPLACRMPPGVNVLPEQICIAEQIPQAVGIAWGMRLRGAKSAVVAMFGEGATSEGAFHEAANFAGVFNTPVVFLCQNNGWAISTPRSRQTASESIAIKAAAYGIAGIQVDGNDVIASYRAMHHALERARSGEGPTLVEALTYRLGPHTTSDDPTRYRPNEELAAWRDTRDPVGRLRAYLERAGLWDDARQASLEEDVNNRVAQTVRTAIDEPEPPPEVMFDYTYAVLPPALEAQRREVQEDGRRKAGKLHG
ncbi:MAG: pyruvate dehydrogenase (acetyl-transferring) component, alpha subunit [Chloroflexi bacterium]|jgi:pyruvate dehydrogenase E1 component alpha subunit|nr:pyruvate dehydrogenase (acetyl-transferring) component, alpha subunit [Chloroflexota bacterium]MDB5077624.1 pyruvate dehydrogenase (acetyl-transferring) component, alpha subunit [Chloroflexota bacterium]